jgi:hypothetical protein
VEFSPEVLPESSGSCANRPPNPSTEDDAVFWMDLMERIGMNSELGTVCELLAGAVTVGSPPAGRFLHSDAIGAGAALGDVYLSEPQLRVGHAADCN